MDKNHEFQKAMEEQSKQHTITESIDEQNKTFNPHLMNKLVSATPLAELHDAAQYYSKDEKYTDAVAHINTAIFKIKQIHERENTGIGASI